MKKYYKKIIWLSLIIIILIILFCIAFFTITSKKEQKATQKQKQIIKKETKKIISKLNETNNEKEYKNELRETLDEYYNANKENQIKGLENKISLTGKEIINNYKEAEKERNKKDLNYQTGTVLVAIANEDKNDAEQIAQNYRGTLKNTIEMDDKTLLVINTSLEYTVDKSISNYETIDETINAQPNYMYKLPEEKITTESIKEDAKETFNSISNDYGDDSDYYLLPYNWHLQTNYGVGIKNTWNSLDNISDKQKVKVAVIDSGIYVDHEDLQSALSSSKATIGKSYSRLVTIDSGYGIINSYSINDNNGHGTHVSGLIAATSNNNLGVAGVGAGNNNDMIELVGVDACYGASDCETFYSSDLIKSIDYVENLGVKVINMSLGGYGQDEQLHSKITEAYNSGITFVAAAGNGLYSESRNIYVGVEDYVNPSDFEESISVIALTSNNTKAVYSNYGSEKDISAPGGAGNGDSSPGYMIYSTIPDYESGDDTYKYAWMSGTSQAAPIVSGVLGMLYSVKPNMTPNQMKTFLYNSATDLGTTGKDNTFGLGKINPSALLTAITQTSTANTAPTITTLSLKNYPATGGTAYSYSLNAIGSPSNFTWSITSGSLPTGLSLSNSGVISGTPTEIVSNKSFTVKADNGVSPASTKTLTLTVNGIAPTITTQPTLPNGMINSSYSASLTVTGYPNNFTWSITSGSLPNGLSLSENGVISGMPTEVVNSKKFIVKVTNNVTNDSTSKEFEITIYNDQLSTPTNMKSVLNTYNSTLITWNNVLEATSYQIYYKRADETNWRTTTTTLNYKRIYNLTPGYRYYFKVVAYNNYVRSPYSNTTYIYTLKKPTLKLSKSGYKTIKVKYSDIPGESGYEIYRKTYGKKWKLVKTRSYKLSHTWKNTKMTRGKRYYYRIRAYTWVNSKKVYGPYSKTKSILR